MLRFIAFGLTIILVISCGQNDEETNNNGEFSRITADQPGAEWKEISSVEGNFKILFPDFPLKEGKKTLIENGEHIVVNYFKMNLENELHECLAYQIDYTLFPDIQSSDEIQYQFDLQRAHLMGIGTIDYEAVIDTLQFPGRHLFVSIKESQVKLHIRFYFHGKKLYKLGVITINGNHFNKSIHRFFDSFSILSNE